MMLDLRPVAAEDFGFLRELIIASSTEELAAWAWPEPMRANLLEMQYRARLQGIQGNYPHAAQDIAIEDGKPVAWRVVARDSSQIHLVEIIVAPERRGAGIGAALVGELLEESSRTGIPVRLMVSIMNQRAIQLYQRLGFKRTGGTEVLHEMTYTRPVINCAEETLPGAQ